MNWECEFCDIKFKTRKNPLYLGNIAPCCPKCKSRNDVIPLG